MTVGMETQLQALMAMAAGGDTDALLTLEDTASKLTEFCGLVNEKQRRSAGATHSKRTNGATPLIGGVASE